MKKILIAAALTLMAVGFNAQAHGNDKAQHGGVVRAAGDMSFELVAQGDGALLFVGDHGSPLDASQFTGKLTVLNGAEKSEVELKPAGGNKLAAGPVKLGKGAKAVATITLPSSKTLTVRFSMK